MTATPAVMAVGFVLGSAGAYLIQRKGAKDGAWSAALKALLAGIGLQGSKITKIDPDK